MKNYMLVSWNVLFSGRGMNMEMFKSEKAMHERKAELENNPYIKTCVKVKQINI